MSAYAAERARLLSIFGENLRALRTRRNLAQEALAEVASLHRNEIGVLERGQGEPGLLTLLILADALEVPVAGAGGRGARPEGPPAGETPQGSTRPRGGAAMTRRCAEETVDMTTEGSKRWQGQRQAR